WVLINGEKESGVTTFFLKHDIDTGHILFTEKITLTGHETAGELHDRLMDKGAGLLVKTVKAIESGRFTENPQEHLTEGIELKHAPKIFKEDCNINWNQPAEKAYNFIRGLSPYPTAYTTLNDKMLKVFGAEYELAETGEAPGEFFSDNRTFLKVSTTDGFVNLTDVQMEGKKRMGIHEFLRGVRL
ncbi:MAG TPA: formyltransferase family protein, partial [Mucilaginibacter sp.]|nr:formyltransferase family protein [Mucilaginibacter sp.]